MILPIEKQVCSLELARKLKELGVPQESLFWWNRNISAEKTNPGQTGDWFLSIEKARSGLILDSYYMEGISAFTVAELGEMLKKFSQRFLNHSWPTWDASLPGFVFHKIHVPKGEKHFEVSETEADSRAAMLIFLIEQGLVKP